MLIPNERIDNGCTSTRVDNNTIIRVDKISVIIPVIAKTNQETKRRMSSIAEAINKIESSHDYIIKHNVRFKDRKKQYLRNVTIRSKHNDHRYLFFECQPINKNTSFCRLEFSPQHWNINDLNNLLLSLFGFINQKAIKLLKDAYISRLDLAIDINEHIMSDLIVHLDGSRTGSITSCSAPYGLKLGSPTSQFSLSCYEKYTYIGATPLDTKKDMVRVNSNDIEEFTRFEIRYRPKNRVLLSELSSMEEFVSKLHLYDREAILSRARTHVKFKNAIQTMTLPEVWATQYTDNSREGRARKQKMRKILASNEFDFGADRIWACWPECISKLGVLAQPEQWDRIDMTQYSWASI